MAETLNKYLIRQLTGVNESHARVLSEDERKALGEVRAACVRKAAADGSKEILLFLQEHGARSVFDLDSKFYPDLLKICNVKEDC